MQTYGNPGHDLVSKNIPFMIPGFFELVIDVATNIEISLEWLCHLFTGADLAASNMRHVPNAYLLLIFLP